MLGRKFISIGILIALFAVGFSGYVSASRVLETDSYLIYEDRDLFEEVKPGLIGELPDIIYYRIMEPIGVDSERIVCIMNYWYWQNASGAAHQHDWEFIFIWIDDNNYTTKVAYDSYHYIIGRVIAPRLYNESHIILNVKPGYHYYSVESKYKGTDFGEASLNYTSTSKIEYLQMENMKDVAVQIGFNEELFYDPELFFAEGWFGYKKHTAFRSMWRSFVVRADAALPWFEFGKMYG